MVSNKAQHGVHKRSRQRIGRTSGRRDHYKWWGETPTLHGAGVCLWIIQHGADEPLQGLQWGQQNCHRDNFILQKISRKHQQIQRKLWFISRPAWFWDCSEHRREITSRYYVVNSNKKSGEVWSWKWLLERSSEWQLQQWWEGQRKGWHRASNNEQLVGEDEQHVGKDWGDNDNNDERT